MPEGIADSRHGRRVEGAAPLAILVDYDGTITHSDVSDVVLADHARGDWAIYASQYHAGLIGSRRLLESQMSLMRGDAELILQKAMHEVHDQSFVPLVRSAQAAGIPVEVVSDGFGLFAEDALRRLGLPEVPVITARTELSGDRASISFPHGHPRCYVCGTCKRQRVLLHQDAGRAVVFVGDSYSDQYAAGYADVVFAKEDLVSVCVANGWPYRDWTSFDDVRTWLETRVDQWRKDAATLAPPVSRPYFCGPEVWGDGVREPPRRRTGIAIRSPSSPT